SSSIASTAVGRRCNSARKQWHSLRVMHVMRTLLLLALVACGHSKQSVDLYESGDYAGAARAADQGLASHPDDDGLWAMRVRSALALGDAGGLAKAWEGYVAHGGDDDKALIRELA